MSDILTPFYSALRTAIVAAWPEVSDTAGGGGIWYGADIAKVDFETVIGAGGAFASTDEEWAPVETYGIANPQSLQATVAVQYCVLNTVDLETIMSKLLALKAQVWGASAVPLTAGQVISEPYPSFSTRLPANFYFFTSQQPFIAGALMTPCLIGETR